jgi:hypothetical protein
MVPELRLPRGQIAWSPHKRDSNAVGSYFTTALHETGLSINPQTGQIKGEFTD